MPWCWRPTAWPGMHHPNGGQAQCASGRLKRSEWITRWGLDTALALHAECVDAMDYFRAQIADIDCDAQPGGHLYIAHRPQRMPVLEKEAKLLRETFHYDAQILDADTLRGQYIDDHEAAGAMHEPEGIGVHPAKLAFGYVRKARALGVKVHPASRYWAGNGRGKVQTNVTCCARRAVWCVPAPWAWPPAATRRRR